MSGPLSLFSRPLQAWNPEDVGIARKSLEEIEQQTLLDYWLQHGGMQLSHSALDLVEVKELLSSILIAAPEKGNLILRFAGTRLLNSRPGEEMPPLPPNSPVDTYEQHYPKAVAFLRCAAENGKILLAAGEPPAHVALSHVTYSFFSLPFEVSGEEQFGALGLFTTRLLEKVD